MGRSGSHSGRRSAGCGKGWRCGQRLEGGGSPAPQAKEEKATVKITPYGRVELDIIDFSVMGYGGNLWQRLPRQTIHQNWEILGTAMRFAKCPAGFNFEHEQNHNGCFVRPEERVGNA